MDQRRGGREKWRVGLGRQRQKLSRWEGSCEAQGSPAGLSHRCQGLCLVHLGIFSLCVFTSGGSSAATVGRALERPASSSTGTPLFQVKPCSRPEADAPALGWSTPGCLWRKQDAVCSHSGTPVDAHSDGTSALLRGRRLSVAVPLGWVL